MTEMQSAKDLVTGQCEELLGTLQARFEDKMNRHPILDWPKIQTRLAASPEKLWSLHAMEMTGGEPDVVSYDQVTGEYIFYDCSAESPKGHRTLCYDRAALEAKKKINQPITRWIWQRPWGLSF